MKKSIKDIKDKYDYTLIDCIPSLWLLTINAYRVIVPIRPQFLVAKNLEQLVTNVMLVKKSINLSLYIDGILLTLVDN
ncbi:MAG: AAA family ATPase [Acholeplasma sp.]|nr:AAA family ATPase [Acholeplasma sp.]